MKTILLSMSLIIITAFFGCKKDDGLATTPSFSNRDIVMTSAQNEITLQARNDVNWFFSDVRINGVLIERDGWDTDPLIKYKTILPIDPDNTHLTGIYEIEYDDWLYIEKLGNTQLKIRLAENISNTNREVSFRINVGNASEIIHVVQEIKTN